MSVDASSLLQGTLIGGSLGAFIAWGLMSKWSQVAENEDKALAGSLALLHAHRQLCSDSILYVALQEPLRAVPAMRLCWSTRPASKLEQAGIVVSGAERRKYSARSHPAHS